MPVPEEYTRKVSKNNQFSVPPEYRKSDEFLVPEPGTFYSEGELRMYPPTNPPEICGEFAGEQRRITLTSSGQVSIPKAFREQSDIYAGDDIEVEQVDDWWLKITKTDSTDE